MQENSVRTGHVGGSEWLRGGLFAVALIAFSSGLQATEHKVFAHYMVALPTYGTSEAAFQHDIQDAQAAGIDGFALNCGSWSVEPRYQTQSATLFQAAKDLGTNFQLFFSADVTTNLTATDIVNMIKTYGNHPNYFRYNNQPVLSTFSGQSWGQTTWQNSVLTPLANAGFNVFFTPFFYPSPITETPDYTSVLNNFNGWWQAVDNGMFYFGAAGLPFYGSMSLLTANEAYAKVCRDNGRMCMSSYTPQYWGVIQSGRRYMEFQGGEGTAAQWNSIIGVQNPPWVEIVTWNDFNEASYMTPVDDANKYQSYLIGGLGFHKTHAGLLEMNKYYINWFKSGVQPAITQDAMFYAYRTHPKDLVASNDPQGAVSYKYGNVQDVIYVTTRLTQPAVLQVTTGGAVKSYNVGAGIVHTQVPFNTGTQSFALSRNGAVIASKAGDPIQSSITIYNFNYTSGFAYGSVVTPPPAAPTNLTATAGNAQVSLSWGSSSGATSYNVKRSTSSGGPYTTISNVTATSSVDTGVISGTAYYYVVSAINANGESVNSNQASATPAGVPAAPTNLTATAGNAQVNLSWSASSGATSYNVRRATTSGGPYTAVATTVTTTSYVDTALTNGTVYYYVTNAVNASGTSGNSNEVSATPAGAPAAPTNLTATAGNSQVSLSWSASSGATSYSVERSTTSGGPYTAVANGLTTASYADTALANGTTYYYVACAWNAAGESADSNQASATPAGVPAAPANLTASAGTAQVSLSWSACSGATSYSVERSTTSGGPYTAVANGLTTASYADTAVTNGTTYYYVACAWNAVGESPDSNQATATPTGGTLPPPWIDLDIGSVGFKGSGSLSGSTFSVSGSGADIWGTADAFNFTYQPLNGDGQIVARVVTVQNTDPWAKAGVMIRETTAVDSKFALMAVTPGYGTAFQRRLATTGTCTNTSGATAVAPYWVKLVRAGTMLTAYQSADGVTWATVGSDTLSMTTSVYAGLAVTAHNNTLLNASTFDNVTVSTSTPPPPGGLPAPWVDKDIGTVNVAGTATYSNGVFTVKGSGGDIWNTSDAFNYCYQPMSGDATIVARVTGIQSTNSWAKAGLMIRETLANNSTFMDVVMTPSNGIVMQYRGKTGGSCSGTSSNTMRVPYWVKLTRSGTTLTAYASSNGTSWATVGSANIVMASNVYVGMAVTSHSNSALNTSTFDNVSFGAGIRTAMMESEIPAQAFNLTTLKMKTDFTRPGRDSSVVEGKLQNLEPVLKVSGALVTLDVGGASVSFTLDDSGSATSNNGRFCITYNQTADTWTFKALLSHGNWSDVWAAAGMSRDVRSDTLQVPVTLTIGDRSFEAAKTVRYTSARRKVGFAR
ncbi:MAG TPA: endo-1,3-alpha-glucanase family glycosylhydrolase [Planctomycetota bacterium]|jgi:fibronectin type 3 domain-containing protein/regulation of enolase protein 1 (concanavalin A-like superfamily)